MNNTLRRAPHIKIGTEVQATIKTLTFPAKDLSDTAHEEVVFRMPETDHVTYPELPPSMVARTLERRPSDYQVPPVQLATHVIGDALGVPLLLAEAGSGRKQRKCIKTCHAEQESSC